MAESKECWKCGTTGTIRHPGSVHLCDCEAGRKLERELASSSSSRETVDVSKRKGRDE